MCDEIEFLANDDCNSTSIWLTLLCDATFFNLRLSEVATLVSFDAMWIVFDFSFV